jgi:hypothetical protein
MNIKGICEVKKWDEKVYSDLSDKMKISKADVEYSISGEIEGKAVVQYVMFYSYYNNDNPHDSSSEFVGLIEFSGKIGDKCGSFVFEDKGSFKSGVVSSDVKILVLSGTSDFTNISGKGKYIADQNGFKIELDVEI